MRYTYATAFAALAAAAPVAEKRASGITDAIILNYALTLEHLEDTFYKQGLANYTEADFVAAGVNPGFYNNLKEISSDEETHVSFLTSALSAAGAVPVEACTYDFGATDAATFLAIANVLEGVGVSAYLGAAQYIMNKDYLTAAGSILTVESRHNAFIRENQTPKQSPFPSAFDIPLDFDEVFSLAAPFIVTCPQGKEGSLGLPVKAFPALTVTAPAGTVASGAQLTIKVASGAAAATNAWFITSSGAVAAPLSGDIVTVPADAPKGQSYLVLTKNANTPTDDNISAGPAVIMIADNDAGQSTSTASTASGSSYGTYSNYGTYPKLSQYGSYGKYSS
ncbi:hypothetical protein DOTSEDRAFT_69222 [Dothistroma septosporum NZE10]|uniref:Uncharacterized protein n=1 Tax=Dothistroma septosporum (strain NZE10 / CBS 128990) TaxID=675120 RepID=N1PYB4_DOTSN|nr:hypothetical protein DOTSEDRAFT_69222 [Dothistroma septosporum NZE10]